MSEPGNGPFNNRRYYPNFGRKTMPEAIRERNEAVAEGRRYVNDQKAANDAREQFITYVEKAAARNKHIDLQVYRDIIAAYDAEYTQYIALVEAGKKDPEMAAQAQEARNTMVSRVNKRIEKHGAMGEEAMRTIANEKQPESFFTPIVRQVYDSDKGGLQVGGILGALLGGAGAYFAGGQFGLGTLFKLGLTAGGVALGTYLGNKVLPSEDTLKVT
ncbi:MAG: hypothetical protein EBV03_10465, partial [Proteobacteria bacterium]|nr:hypothetical protein [Pseudomonadota bacterium]